MLVSRKKQRDMTNNYKEVDTFPQIHVTKIKHENKSPLCDITIAKTSAMRKHLKTVK